MGRTLADINSFGERNVDAVEEVFVDTSDRALNLNYLVHEAHIGRNLIPVVLTK